jgi:hypothetical protein
MVFDKIYTLTQIIMCDCIAKNCIYKIFPLELLGIG